MTHVEWTFLPMDRQQLGLGRHLGDALASLVKKRFPYHTAKSLETRWNIARETAINITKGHGSERTLTRGAHAEMERGEFWAFWMRLGAEISGETYEESEERRLARIVEEAELARQNLTRLRSRRHAHRQSAAQLGALLDGKPAARTWAGAGRLWGSPGGESAYPPAEDC